MADVNKRNLQYFEASSMHGLFDSMNAWQEENQKRLLSISVQCDNGLYCCIALTNPSEVVITDKYGNAANVERGCLAVHNWPG